MMGLVSYLSSVATLILFILYFIGRIWVINRNKKLLLENFELEYLENDDLERKNQYNLGGSELITISSTQGINWLKIYRVKFDSKKNKMVIVDKNPVIYHKFLNVNEKLYIKDNIPCGIPMYRIEYERLDYIQGEFDISLDGKYGGLFMDDFKSKLTIKSYLYYICK
ncbi:TPA: hypothetical protein ACOTHO_002425 [Clostridium perfringens]|nr:hypothetical protein [Clostridium perfringens]MDU2168944.1 hypothetical protein [Clostridium perfringens]MDU6143960.1 hypothetical protein [Clostridium perfringens]HAT4166096.1 hypothetical protein [Clostridium perfringens]